jgi:hypothetical protein
MELCGVQKKNEFKETKSIKTLSFYNSFCTNPLPPKHCCPLEAILGINHNSANQLKLDE